MNQKKLAQLAGVSPATVSKAFHYSDRISPETRERIFAIAREHNCFEKFSKGKYPKKLIVVFSPEISSDFYNLLVINLEKRILSAGAIMSLIITGFDAQKEQEYFDYYSKEGRADGIILLDPQSQIQNPDFFPSVALFPNQKQTCDTIHVDWSPAVNEAIQLLKRTNRQNIVFIGERLTSQKLSIFRECMQKNHLPILEKNLYISDLRFENAGKWAVEQLMQQPKMPEAIIAAYDYIAFGAIAALKEAGYRIPEDIAVIGMDDIHLNQYVDIPLTTIQIHFEELCDAAMDLITKKMDNRYYFLRQEITVNASLFFRNST